ncbi:tRNA methyltransferase [Trypanosoma conorhini]|uniref:tRNA methyltransferase n=1 Tax=Trypanosoma conorhini TaxID=83891 RepID=A0A3R7LAP2_9TRYP|nr:tRNA methyltransferase [Trypanosoma conorhini]RNF19636.1 tRNA methyltransferase [Trypanosoma conorhini]
MADAAEVPPARLAEGDALEREHVLEVYDAIAAHFSSTRYKAWPKVQAFIEALPKCALVADVGCGNGKYFACAQRHRAEAAEAEGACRYVVGIDASEGLLRLAQRQLRPQGATDAGLHDAVAGRTDLLRADGRRTALRGGLFDAVVSVAVLHHFATHAGRVEALRELLRLVRRDGVVLVSVWAKEQPRKRSRGDAADVFIPWEMHEQHDKARRVYQRYYHLFAEGELEGLAAEAGAVVRASYYDKENWCAVLAPA